MNMNINININIQITINININMNINKQILLGVSNEGAASAADLFFAYPFIPNMGFGLIWYAALDFGAIWLRIAYLKSRSA